MNGPYTLYMVAGGGNKLPYGTLPRLLLAWVCTEAVRTQSPELILGDSLSEFMRKVGIYSTSGDKHTRLRNQMRRLFGCTVSLANLQSRGLRTDRSLLVILDGALALHKAVRAVFGEAALIQRCQVHKLRSILDHLPERQRPWGQAIVRRAYQATDVKTATRLLTDLAKRLEDEYPSAAGSVREGLDETLTVLTLHLSTRLQRSLATTNAAESLLSRTRHVKRWRGGQMMLRWVAAGVLEAVKGFRRLKGCGDMPRLVSALRARDQRLGLRVSEVNVA